MKSTWTKWMNGMMLGISVCLGAEAIAAPEKTVGIFYNTLNQHNWLCIANCAEDQWPSSVYGGNNHSWGRPAIGHYDSRSTHTIDKHAEWLAQAGVDYVMMDWSNNMGSAIKCTDGGPCWRAGWEWCEQGERRAGRGWGPGNHCSVGEIEDGGLAFIKRMAQRKAEGKPYVKVTIAVGTEGWCDSLVDLPGNPGMMTRQLNILKRRFIDNPEFKGVWHHVNGKPFAVVWLGGCGEYWHDNVNVTREIMDPSRQGFPKSHLAASQMPRLDWGRNQPPPFSNNDFEWRYMDTELSGRNLVNHKDRNTGYQSAHGMWSLFEAPKDMQAYTVRAGVPEQMTVAAARRWGDAQHGHWDCKDGGKVMREEFDLARRRGVHTLLVSVWNFWAKGEEKDANCSFTIEPQDPNEPGSYGDSMLRVMAEEIEKFKGYKGNRTGGGNSGGEAGGGGAPSGESGANQSCVVRSASRHECFYRGSDAALWQRSRILKGSVWTLGAPKRLGGSIKTHPSCTAAPGGVISCFARGADDHLVQLQGNGTTWRDWQDRGGRITNRPSCHASGGTLTCVARGADAQDWEITFDGSIWKPWRPVAIGCQSATLAEGTYLFKPMHTDRKAIDVEAFSRELGGKVHQWDAHGAPNQLWKVSCKSDKGTYEIRNINSGLCLSSTLDVNNEKQAVQRRCNGRAHNLWQLKQTGQSEGKPVVQLVSRRSGKCLDVFAEKSDNGTAVQLYDCHNGQNQQFRAERR